MLYRLAETLEGGDLSALKRLAIEFSSGRGPEEVALATLTETICDYVEVHASRDPEAVDV
ncbi:MAG: hypothetical protein K5905_19035 [Roseibium sp.]|uniref:hypothetical protein n=1 Tax=Roseibium sp. TaxID=1936156 RepID=UPI0026076A90|nr:hypothetical protein [Roseibium sp.]MCV0427559.1 hypothetical protein [Roseibium sp.]